MVLLFVIFAVFIIPDVPSDLKQKIKREKYLIQEIMLRSRDDTIEKKKQ